ncbi:MAG: hypothetical protein PHI86_04585 [Candidatus Omnitrophica bacterium]|nr:hypothetical protein [Candidatus Omnitrophota bacterium]HOX54939.1 hypothetical protein [Candidatus Omnitrophota bacterium]
MNRVFFIITVIIAVCFCQQIFSWAEENIDRDIVQQDIQDAIRQANYCDTTDDCMIIYLACPFGCGAYINKKEEKNLKEKVGAYFLVYNEQCVYDCVRPIDPACVNQKCVPAVCEKDKLNKLFACECPEGTEYSEDLDTNFKCVTIKEE